ncbi:glycoside hydrolase family 3 protein [Halalkalibacter alkaliphilus]|uniref:beta-glucosidase n=1 Tax=Halalkalibacter alkaliphilus TaxID=2917993 RepID=A0A9X2CX96_9BACI|nr:glycoside hydrolase family 3 N-terminal domain-containing protein [Halalkalibacter alkaliphilus]MCL7749720.1 glycoside hydrolase family 3 C-terminal domain-containing protein [Halalkalibacter alkaliphilus]
MYKFIQGKKLTEIKKQCKKVIMSTLAVSLVIPAISVAADDREDLGYVPPSDGIGDEGFISTFDRIHFIDLDGNAELGIANEDNVITEDGLFFKDLNGNGVLDPYEDWRLPVEERVENLVSKMTLKQKAGLMNINTHRINHDLDGGEYVADDDELIVERGMRYTIFRTTESANVVAQYTNQLQEIAEKQPLGIPVVVTSNPRNHPSINYTDVVDEPGQHSFWPGQLGMAATRDVDMVREFAEIAAQEWRAMGIRKIYGYTADLATDPLWSRIEETFGEDPQLAADMMYALVKGFQGDELGPNSIAKTVKHFPGGGAREDGLDPHFPEGKRNPYPTPGSLMDYHIVPFKAVIDAGVSSLMPYYSFPSNDLSADQGLPWFSEDQQFEEVGFTFNSAFINDLLREEMGFKGYINSDTGAVNRLAFGLEDLPEVERFARAINAGTDLISGNSDPQPIIDTVEQGLVEEERIDEAVSRLLTEMYKLGLFENPYVDPQNALEVVDRPESQEKADVAHRKSVVLMKNEDNVLPLRDEKIGDIVLYVEMFTTADNDAEITAGLMDLIEEYDGAITLTDNLDEATHAFVWVQPVQSMWENNVVITVGSGTGIEDVDRIVEIQQTVPTITTISMTNPWLFEVIEENAAAVIATFGVKTEALWDVIRGEFNPSGLLPFTIPASMEAIENGAGDIPGYLEDESYAYTNSAGDQYWFGFGLSYEKDHQELWVELKDLTEGYIESGDVSGPAVKQLTNLLRQSKHHLDKGSKENATRFIENYVSHLQRDTNDRHITSEAKEHLTRIASVILNK